MFLLKNKKGNQLHLVFELISSYKAVFFIFLNIVKYRASSKFLFLDRFSTSTHKDIKRTFNNKVAKYLIPLHEYFFLIKP